MAQAPRKDHAEETHAVSYTHLDVYKRQVCRAPIDCGNRKVATVRTADARTEWENPALPWITRRTRCAATPDCRCSKRGERQDTAR